MKSVCAAQSNVCHFTKLRLNISEPNSRIVLKFYSSWCHGLLLLSCPPGFITACLSALQAQNHPSCRRDPVSPRSPPLLPPTMFSLPSTLSHCLRKCKQTVEDCEGSGGGVGGKLLWDREDGSHCTINNPVKLCVAKACSAAILSSFLTPHSGPPTVWLPPSFSSFPAFPPSLPISLSEAWIRAKGKAFFSCRLLLAPFTIFLDSKYSWSIESSHCWGRMMSNPPPKK